MPPRRVRWASIRSSTLSSASDSTRSRSSKGPWRGPGCGAWPCRIAPLGRQRVLSQPIGDGAASEARPFPTSSLVPTLSSKDWRSSLATPVDTEATSPNCASSRQPDDPCPGFAAGAGDLLESALLDVSAREFLGVASGRYFWAAWKTSGAWRTVTVIGMRGSG